MRKDYLQWHQISLKERMRLLRGQYKIKSIYFDDWLVVLVCFMC